MAGQLVSDMTKAKSDIDDLSELVGTNSVSEQIEEAFDNYVASEEDISAMLDEVFASEN